MLENRVNAYRHAAVSKDRAYFVDGARRRRETCKGMSLETLRGTGTFLQARRFAATAILLRSNKAPWGPHR